MKKISRFKLDRWLLAILLTLAVLSILTIYSAVQILPSYLSDLPLRQLLWYVAGFFTIFFILAIGHDFIYKHIWILYGIGIASLALLLLFGTPINHAKCWFTIPGIGTLQPSEFMKIILIITIAVLIDQFHKQYQNPSVKEEFLFLCKIGLVVFIPSFLTFLQPDTGVVLIYLLITVVMLFVAGIRYRWFVAVASLFLLGIAAIVLVYFMNQELFIKIFGTDFFLRIDRLLDWSNKSGYQLENGLAAIGSGGLWGHGLAHTPLYFPEPQTDFIFAVFASNFGLMGSLFLLFLLLSFHIRIIGIASSSRDMTNKYVIAGIVGMLLYQQLQNIGMTIGLMPITGITLPFISYGGSSLLSYMIMAGIIFSIANETMRYKNGS